MSVSSISNHSVYSPTLSTQADADARPNSGKPSDLVQISDRAKQLLSTQNQTDLLEKKEDEGKETVQVISSIGRLSRITGLQREEVVDLYRTIDKLT